MAARNAMQPTPMPAAQANPRRVPTGPPLRHRKLRRLPLILLVAALLGVASLGLIPTIWNAPRASQLSRLVETLTIALLIALGNVIADEFVERGVARLPAYLAAVVGGALAGVGLGPLLRQLLELEFATVGLATNAVFRYTHPLEMATFGILVGGLITFARVNRRTALAARRLQHDAEQARARAQRRMLESQLQALQARVEPLFLFGTLAHIRRLYQGDVAAAGAMLEALIDFLRAALPQLRASGSTVGQELQLVRSWLDIVGRTAAGSWTVTVTCDDAVRSAPMPALVLLPLVQHAVADRGDAPLRLEVRARRQGARVRVDVLASTHAFEPGCDATPGIAQIGDRLQALYGVQASLAFSPAATAPGGMASVEWPLDLTPEASPDWPR